jgi:glutaredoxin
MRVLLWLLLALCSFEVSAEIYKWVDKDGTVHFEDRKPQAAPYEELKVRSMSGVQTYRAPTRTIKQHAPKSAGKKNVILYGTSWCGYCTKARRYFQANNIPFEDYDIESSASAKSEYDALNGKGVPLILVGDNLMNGFSESHFNQLLKP